MGEGFSMEKGIIVAFSVVSILFALNFALLVLISPVATYSQYSTQKVFSTQTRGYFDSISVDVFRIIFSNFKHTENSILFNDDLNPSKLIDLDDYNSFIYSNYGFSISCSQSCTPVSLSDLYTVDYSSKHITVVPNSILDFDTQLYNYTFSSYPQDGNDYFRLSFGGSVVLDGNYNFQGELLDVNTSAGIFHIVLSNPIEIYYPSQTLLSAEIKLKADYVNLKPFKLYVKNGDYVKEGYVYG